MRKKEKVLEIFRYGHKDFENIINAFNDNQIGSVKVIEEWTMKDLISHISAWNWEQINEIERILNDKPGWKRSKSGNIFGTDEFNRKAVQKRRKWVTRKVMKEWQESFDDLIERIEKLHVNEWRKVVHIFQYEMEGASDEGRHAKAIRKKLVNGNPGD